MSLIFSESEVLAIAQALGDTEDGLTGREIDELFQLCRVRDESPSGTKWRRIYVSLWNQQVRQRTRAASLAFIRKAMRPERHLRDPDRFERMRGSLNRALSFAGLEVSSAGKLNPVARVHTIEEAEARARELSTELQIRGVHPAVLAFCRAELLEDNYFHAVLEAVKSVFEKMRELTGLSQDGARLVDAALGGDAPLLQVNDLSTPSERSEQAGFANLIKGTCGMFRNPAAHVPRTKWPIPKEDAEDLLSLASLVHRRLDTARCRRP